jgi:IS5 family transposase
MESQMRSNKINNADLFTQRANEQFKSHIKTQSKRSLEIIDEKINWKELLKPLETKLEKRRSSLSEAGRKSFSIEVIVKCMLLQTIFNLSDPRLEEEIADRRSFQIFLGLTSGDSIPDETTICRYRKLFADEGLDRKLFESFYNQLKKQNIVVEKGTIVDATIKQAQATHYSNRDNDADFTRKRGKTYYGYKGHIAIDEESEVIKKLEFTKASVHDSVMFDQLVDYSEESVLADKGYANKERREKLESKGIFDGILEKGYRNKTLSKTERKLNRILSTIRNKVERPFAYMKRVLGYSRCSYYDHGRNQFEFIFKALVYNIRRMITLTA